MKISTTEQAANALMMSPTMSKLCGLAQDCPVNVNDPEDLKTALTTCSMQIIEALDNGRIQFSNIEDKAMLHGLLLVAVDYALGGSLKSGAVRARMN